MAAAPPLRDRLSFLHRLLLAPSPAPTPLSCPPAPPSRGLPSRTRRAQGRWAQPDPGGNEQALASIQWPPTGGKERRTRWTWSRCVRAAGAQVGWQPAVLPDGVISEDSGPGEAPLGCREHRHLEGTEKDAPLFRPFQLKGFGTSRVLSPAMSTVRAPDSPEGDIG
ncbi:TEPSIN isoform 9 [Pongo abelii]|uniref:TEPSIN isoform 9 n=1 Tax=Pongo abelii TaxID=9601 RepID=A0A2J8Y2H5_PONAB|nr:TEPSIN isoform 9 [Pongo abelii]